MERHSSWAETGGEKGYGRRLRGSGAQRRVPDWTRVLTALGYLATAVAAGGLLE